MIVKIEFTLSDVPNDKLTQLYSRFYQQWEQEQKEKPGKRQPTDQAQDAKTEDNGQK
jgi:hypothetical protein